MAKTIRKPDAASYVMCAQCSDDFEEETFYPRKALTEEKPGNPLLPFLPAGDGKSIFKCPRGHVVAVPA